MLTGKLNKLQHLRGVPLVDEAYEFWKNIDKSKNIKAIRLNNDLYYFEKEYSKKYELTNIKNFKNYQNNYLLKILDYETDIVPKETIFSRNL